MMMLQSTTHHKAQRCLGQHCQHKANKAQSMRRCVKSPVACHMSLHLTLLIMVLTIHFLTGRWLPLELVQTNPATHVLAFQPLHIVGKLHPTKICCCAPPHIAAIPSNTNDQHHHLPKQTLLLPPITPCLQCSVTASPDPHTDLHLM